MLSLTQQLKQSRYIGRNRYLGEMDFGMMLIAAGVLHLVGIGIYNLMPERKPDEIPVKVLNVRFGTDFPGAVDPYAISPESTTLEKASPTVTAETTAENLPKPATPLEDMLSESEKEEKRAQKKRELAKVKNGAGDEAARMLVNNGPVRYVRRSTRWGVDEAANNAGLPANGGSPLGNSTDPNAEILKSYEQLISLWIEKHTFYPEEARKQNFPQGRAKVRINVDKEGKIVGAKILESSGNVLLDKAVPVILRQSSPLPKNPDFDNHLPFEGYTIYIKFKKVG